MIKNIIAGAALCSVIPAFAATNPSIVQCGRVQQRSASQMSPGNAVNAPSAARSTSSDAVMQVLSPCASGAAAH